MIDRQLKQRLGQMMKGVQVVAARHDGVTRAYCSHWVCQVSFDEPIVMASVSPKHDTYPLIVGAGRFTVSILAGDQIMEGQYFSYPGRKFRYVAPEFLTEVGESIVVPNCVAWLECEVFDVTEVVGGRELDHHLVFAEVVDAGDFGRLKEPPLLYSSRLGWRIAGDAARSEGESIRDQLLARVEELDDGVD